MFCRHHGRETFPWRRPEILEKHVFKANPTSGGRAGGKDTGDVRARRSPSGVFFLDSSSAARQLNLHNGGEARLSRVIGFRWVGWFEDAGRTVLGLLDVAGR